MTEWIIDASYNLGLRPDLVDLSKKEVWEIKPEWRYPEALVQITEYLWILNEFTEIGEKEWTAGNRFSYSPPGTVIGFAVQNRVYQLGHGVILYYPFTSENLKVAATAGAAVLALRELMKMAAMAGESRMAGATSRIAVSASTGGRY